MSSMSNVPSRRGFLQKLAIFSGGFATTPLLGSRPFRAGDTGVFNIMNYGAAGDGRTNDAAAIQVAIDRCSAAGGGTVAVPAGKRFLTGSIQLKSNINLLLGTGAELVASTDQNHYRGGTLIHANDAHNVSIAGRGTIQGQGRQFMREELPHIYRAKPWRPSVMILEACSNVRLRDFTIVDSPLWTVHLAGCNDVAINGLSILNDRKVPNCDGIAVDSSRNVRISDCHIEAGDDCIVLKTLQEYAGYGACENVTVHNCTLASTSAALKIGTETVSDIRNVIFNGCVIRDSHRGLAIMLRDQGTVENVVFSNLYVETRLFHPDWWGAAEPIYVTALPRTNETRLGTLRNVRFTNIICRGENGAIMHGTAASPPRDVLLENVKISLDRWTGEVGERQDLRPAYGAGLSRRPTTGVYGRHLRDVVLHRVTVERGGPFRSAQALDFESVVGLENVHFREHTLPS
jgi:polygalacturonase